jgi:hypothetical protein
MKTKPSYNQDVLKIIQKKHGFSYDYIRKPIRGIRIGDTSKLIRTEYENICERVIKALEDQ